MFRIARITIIVTAIVSVFYIAYLWTRPDPIDMLVERGVPVPANATVINSQHSGLFAQYLFVRAKLKRDELDEYRDSLQGWMALNSPGGIRVVTTDLPDSEMMELIEQGTKIRFKHTLHLPWWEIDLIKNGTYHQQELENACGYEVFIDNDELVVYIYWHYS